MSTSLRTTCRVLLTSAFLLTSLTGCATFGNSASSISAASAANLPPVPGYLRRCFNEVVVIPGERGTPLTREQAVTTLGELSASELRKTDCGRQLLAFYDDVAKGRRR